MLLVTGKGAVVGAALWLMGASVTHAGTQMGPRSERMAASATSNPVGVQAMPASAAGGPRLLASPATVLELRPRRARWGRARHANRPPRVGFGAGIAAWEPRDAGVSDAMLHGYIRGYLNEATALQVEAGYWSHGEDFGPVVVPYDDFGDRVFYGKLQDVPVGVSLLYFVSPQTRGWGRRGGRTSLYGGLGVAWHNWTEKYVGGGPVPADWHAQDSRTAFGYHYIAGLELGAFSGGKLFGEYRYTVGRVDNLAGVPLRFDGSSVGGGIGVSF